MSEAVATTGIMVARGAGAVAPLTITGNTAANPTVITTGAAHGLAPGDEVEITGSNSTPTLDGHWVVATAPSGTTLTLTGAPTVTVAGTAGSVQPEEDYTDVGEIVSVTPPGFSRDRLETTTHNDGTESYVLGILRQRDVAFRINYVGDNPTHEQIVEDIFANIKATWRVRFPSGVRFRGPARVQRFEFVDAPTNAIQQADCALTWAGPITMIVP